MNMGLKCVKNKLITATFKEHYFSKSDPQSKLDTHNYYSQEFNLPFCSTLFPQLI